MIHTYQNRKSNAEDQQRTDIDSLQEVVEKLPHAVAITHAPTDRPGESVISYTNAAFQRLTGYPPLALLQRNFAGLLQEEIVAHPADEPVRNQLRRADDASLWVEIKCQPLTTANGSFRWMWTCRDVSAEKTISEEKDAYIEFINTALESSPDCTKVLDASGHLHRMNKNGLCMMEIDDFEQVRNKFWWDLWPEESRPTLKKAVTDALEGGVSRVHAFCPTAKGTPKWWEVTVSAVRVAGLPVQHVLSVSRDVTEKRQLLQQLSDRKELLEAFQEASPLAILFTDRNKGIISFNTNFEDLWQMPADILQAKDDEAALRHAMQQLVNPEQFLQQVHELYASPGRRSRDELHFLDGRVIERFGFPVNTSKEGVVSWCWTFRDITEIKQAELRLERHRQILEIGLQVGLTAVAHIDYATNIVHMSADAAQLYGLGPEATEVSRETIHRTFHPEDKELVEAHVARSLRPGSDGLISLEHRIVHPGGKVRWLDVRKQVFFSNEGKGFLPVYSILAVRDITDQKSISLALAKSEEQFRTLAQSLPQLIFTATAEGIVDYVSASWENYCGHNRSLTEWKTLLYPDDKERFLKGWEMAVSEKKEWHAEVRLCGADNQYRWHKSSVIPVVSKAGELEKWVGSHTDIHLQKTYLTTLEDEVRRRTEELSQSNEELSRFAHIASHDLKEPVRKISMFISKLASDTTSRLSNEGKNTLDRLGVSARRITEMIDGILHYSSMNNEAAKMEPVALNELINDVVTDLSLRLQETGGEVKVHPLPTVMGLPLLLHQLFLNLVSNALKFTVAGRCPTITIKMVESQTNTGENESEGFAAIEVTDNGIGFSNDYSAQLFHLFSRLHPKDKYEGTGLGLAQCKRIVEKHGGYITAEGREGQGAIFRIYLPVAR